MGYEVKASKQAEHPPRAPTWPQGASPASQYLSRLRDLLQAKDRHHACKTLQLRAQRCSVAHQSLNTAAAGRQAIVQAGAQAMLFICLFMGGRE